MASDVAGAQSDLTISLKRIMSLEHPVVGLLLSLMILASGCSSSPGDESSVDISSSALQGGSGPAPAESGRSADPLLAPRTGRITPDGQIIADTFDVRYDLRGNRLTVALETDLPDATAIMVGVDRTFWTEEDSEEYVVEYYSEKSTVGAWRTPRTITMDNAEWKRSLEERRRILSVSGAPFSVRKINGKAELSFVVPMVQDAPFERWNRNLSGKVVTVDEDGRKFIRREAALDFPLDASDLNQTKWADPLDLKVGHMYELDRRTPLVPEIMPADPIAAIAQIEQMSPGTHVRVKEVSMRRNTPWYRVEVFAGGDARRAGWINSTALLGQDLKEIGSE